MMNSEASDARAMAATSAARAAGFTGLAVVEIIGELLVFVAVIRWAWAVVAASRPAAMTVTLARRCMDMASSPGIIALMLKATAH